MAALFCIYSLINLSVGFIAGYRSRHFNPRYVVHVVHVGVSVVYLQCVVPASCAESGTIGGHA